MKNPGQVHKEKSLAEKQPGISLLKKICQLNFSNAAACAKAGHFTQNTVICS
jgi:hypothetical protein